MARRKRYSAEFKREALRRADEPGVTDVLVAEELGINARNLRNWRDAAKQYYPQVLGPLALAMSDILTPDLR
jgi:transposase-like protein